MADARASHRTFDGSTFLALLAYGDFVFSRLGCRDAMRWLDRMAGVARDYAAYLVPVFHALSRWPADLERPSAPYLPVPFLLRDRRRPGSLRVADLDAMLAALGIGREGRGRIRATLRTVPELFLILYVDPGLPDDPELLCAWVRACAGEEGEEAARRRMEDPERFAVLRRMAEQVRAARNGAGCAAAAP